MNIFKSAERYENWLRGEIDGIVEKHIAVKHKKMAESPFEFLRATYWRFAEAIYGVCSQLKGAPQALAVGDIHVENFGTWRDADGRLIWGVNDFDEAAKMPYVLDLVRLATSAVIARVPGITGTAICNSILEGYGEGLKAPRSFVLDREHRWLRHTVIVKEGERENFWDKFDPARIHALKPEKIDPLTLDEVQGRYRKAIEHAQPKSAIDTKFYLREAGTGSLGRPRIFGVSERDGDLVVREAKAMVRSAWTLAHDGGHRLRCEDIAGGPYRSPDPTYRLRGQVLVRRLSPNDFKIEIDQPKKNGKKKKDEKVKTLPKRSLISTRMLSAMGHELASIHCGSLDKNDIEADFLARKSGWLLEAVTAVAKAITAEQKAWKKHPEKWPRPPKESG